MKSEFYIKSGSDLNEFQGMFKKILKNRIIEPCNYFIDVRDYWNLSNIMIYEYFSEKVDKREFNYRPFKQFISMITNYSWNKRKKSSLYLIYPGIWNNRLSHSMTFINCPLSFKGSSLLINRLRCPLVGFGHISFYFVVYHLKIFCFLIFTFFAQSNCTNNAVHLLNYMSFIHPQLIWSN